MRLLDPWPGNYDSGSSMHRQVLVRQASGNRKTVARPLTGVWSAGKSPATRVPFLGVCLGNERDRKLGGRRQDTVSAHADSYDPISGFYVTNVAWE
jgi:hypothetical protein